MLLKFEGAQRVRNPLDRIRYWVREVVHWIDAPLIARPMMRHMGDTVNHRVAHDEIRRCHVDLCTQDARAIWELSRTHAREEVEILLHGAIAVRTFPPRLGQRTAMRANLICREIIYVCKPFLNQRDGISIHLLEVI